MRWGEADGKLVDDNILLLNRSWLGHCHVVDTLRYEFHSLEYGRVEGEDESTSTTTEDIDCVW
jgi:hypothetical protein